MGTTTRWSHPYPADNTANDVPLHMQQLAESADRMAVDAQGLLADRPAAGHAGTYYWATDSEVLFRDNGSSWVQLTPGPWTSWSPSYSIQDGAGNNVVNVGVLVIGTPTYQYRTLPGNSIEIEINTSLKLSGTQRFIGLQLTPPVAATAKSQPLKIDAMNDVARCWIAGGSIYVFPPSGYNAQQHAADPAQPIGQWYVDNYAPGRNFDMCGTYRTS